MKAAQAIIIKTNKFASSDEFPVSATLADTEVTAWGGNEEEAVNELLRTVRRLKDYQNAVVALSKRV